MKRIAGIAAAAVLAAVAVLGVTATSAQADTNWPCHIC
jgi:hypothetical protein